MCQAFTKEGKILPLETREWMLEVQINEWGLKVERLLLYLSYSISWAMAIMENGVFTI